jgi:FkbM family methyltransferase
MKTPEEYKLLNDPLQKGLSDDEICIREGIILKIDNRARYGFEFFSWRSPEMVVEMNCFIEHAKGKTCLLDIGSLHGIFSLVFTEINKYGKAYAFEPAPEAFEILKNNSLLSTRVKPFNKALSDRYGTLNMHREWDHYVSGEAKQNEIKTPISCISGDDFCENHSYVDVAKIDVEGHELKVLKGLYKTIKLNHPLIFLELHTERIVGEGDSVKEVVEMLKELKYKAIDSRTNSSISFDEIESIKEGDIRLILK